MGTKGRNLLLLMFTISAPLAIAGKGFILPASFFINLISGIGVIYYYYYSYKARKTSRGLGLKYVVLLPLNYNLAEFLIKLTGRRFKDKGLNAFEVHIKSPKLSLTEFLQAMDVDLNLAKSLYPQALFLWETPAPIPSSIRALVKKSEKEGNGFLEKGKWPVPHIPFIETELNHRNVRRGAILLRNDQTRGRCSRIYPLIKVKG